MTARARLGLVAGLGIGACTAVQARINGALGARLHDGIAAATISFGIGVVVLAVVFSFSAPLRDGVRTLRRAVSDGALRPWQLLGGVCGAFFVASQGLTVAALGMTAFTVAVVAGQLASSLVVDRLGLGPSGPTPVTGVRLAGAGLGVLAVALAGLGHPGTAGGLPISDALRGGPTAALIMLPALAGIGVAWQQAMNGRVGAIGSPTSAAMVNFCVGFGALLVCEAALIATTGAPDTFPTEPWLYLGGLIGIAVIAVAALTVRWIGVLLLGLTSVAGQLVASLVLDVLTPTEAGLSGTAIVGCLLTISAIGVATRSWR
ncbi:DMT family transporter [Nocardia sp. CNY236]|uniref:DMT family transporter n=1 Tax=Nocardia sp. CNY236 TaxID=1169152 RepID=UPI00048E5B71|nr:DMT family transporter [Nocardia sp. CNY236]